MVSGALFVCFPLHRYFCNLEKTVINKRNSNGEKYLN